MSNSSVAAEKAGCLLRVLKASAQVRAGPGAGGGPEEVVRFCTEERLAATDLQKRVLIGSERHWEQVPGPLAQGSVGSLLSEGCRDRGDLLLWYWRAPSLATSAQIHGVPSEQKPHGSGGAIAGMVDDAVEVDVVRVGGGRVMANCDVKSISFRELSSFSCRTRLLSPAA